MPNLTRVYTAYTPGIRPAWDVDEVRRSLTAHEGGTFESSAMMSDAMMRDERLAATLETRINGLLGLPFEMLAAEEDDETARQLAEELGPKWLDFFPEAEIAEMRRWRILMGFALVELVWQRRSKEWWPRAKVWNPQWLWYDEERHVWNVQTREGLIEAKPGDGKWVLLGRGSRPWMYGAIRSLAVPWLVRQYAQRDWARYSERHGLPLVKAMIPSMVQDEEKADFFNDVQMLATETTVTLPQNVDAEGTSFDLELLEAKDASWEGFERLMTSCNVSMAITLLGQNLTTEIQGGSYAAAEVHNKIRYDYLRADAEELSTELRAQMLSHVCKLNYGSEYDLTPWPNWNAEEPDDVKSAAEALKIAGEALTAIQTAGYVIADENEFTERFGIAVRRSDGEPAAPAPAPEPAAPEAPNADDMADVPEQSGRRVARRVRLASGDDPSDAQGFVEGQLYVDDVIDDGVSRSARKMRPDLRRVIEAVSAARDYGELRELLRAAYADMPVERFADLMEKALVLSELAGRHAVLQDV